MKIAPRDFDSWRRTPAAYAAALIYGTDAGQVRQRVSQAIETWLGAHPDPMAQVEITAEQLKNDPALLADELAAMSLMAPRRVVLVREVEDNQLAAIEAAFIGRASDNYLLMYSTESLQGNSKLRAWGERESKVATLACYKDEGAGLEQFIRDSLKGYGLHAGNEVVRYLATQLSGDRQIIVNELEKLSLYLGDEAEEITIEDAIASVGENNDLSFDALNNALAAGDIVTLCRLSDRLLAEGQPGLLIVRSVMRYISRLEAIAYKRQEGMSIDAAIETLRPPVFFKAKPLLKSHAARWTVEGCTTALAQLQRLELDSKRYSDAAPARLAHGLMTVAALWGQQKRFA